MTYPWSPIEPELSGLARFMTSAPEIPNSGLAAFGVQRPSALSGLSGLGTAAPYLPMTSGLAPSYFAPVAPISPPRWIHVTRRFDALIEAMGILPNQQQDGATKIESVTACLHRAYYGVTDPTSHALLAGSWARQTRVRPSGDIDLMFVIPYDVYLRFEARSGNRQSQLLQEIKGVLAQTFTRTTLRGDGQVVVVAFDTIKVEVVPAILLTDGRYWVCDTHDGGRYKVSDPQALADDLDAADRTYGGSARHLARMAKLWKRQQAVPIKSYLLERLAVEFLRGWSHPTGDRFWYDWMVRDYFAYLASRANTFVVKPGTMEFVWLGDAWLSAAKSARENAELACTWEEENWDDWAADGWRLIFGAYVAKTSG